MNWDSIELGWKDYKASAKQQWHKLSHAQLDSTHGKREQLALRVQQAYGVSREEAERQMAAWQARQKSEQAPEILKV